MPSLWLEIQQYFHMDLLGLSTKQMEHTLVAANLSINISLW